MSQSTVATSTRLPRALAVLAALALSLGARECEKRASLRVELRSDTAAERGRLVAGDTFAVAHLDQQRAVTVAVAPAEPAIEAFKRAFEQPARPAASGAVELTLPAAPPPDLVGVPLEIILFADANRDGRWSGGETYVASWQGGRGSYRVVFVKGAGWSLVEGGEPPASHALADRIVVSIDPVMRIVERQ